METHSSLILIMNSLAVQYLSHKWRSTQKHRALSTKVVLLSSLCEKRKANRTAFVLDGTFQFCHSTPNNHKHELRWYYYCTASITW